MDRPHHAALELRASARFTLMLLSLGLAACGGGGGGSVGGPNGTVAQVVIAPGGLTLPVGGGGGLTADAQDAGGTSLPGTPITWSSLNSFVATVDSNGNVGGVGVGLTKVLAAAGGLADTVPIAVVDSGCGGIAAVSGWKVNLEMFYGDDATLPNGADVYAVYYFRVASTLSPAAPVLGKMAWTGDLVVGVGHPPPNPASPLTMSEYFTDTLSDPTELGHLQVVPGTLPIPTPGLDGFRLEVDPTSCTFQFFAAPSAHISLTLTEHAVNVLPGPLEGTHIILDDVPFGILQKGRTPLGALATAGMVDSSLAVDAYPVGVTVPATVDAFTPSGIYAQPAFFDPLNPAPKTDKATIYWSITPLP